MKTSIMVNGKVGEDADSIVQSASAYMQNTCDETMFMMAATVMATREANNGVEKTWNLRPYDVLIKASQTYISTITCEEPMIPMKEYHVTDLKCKDSEGNDPFADQKEIIGEVDEVKMTFTAASVILEIDEGETLELARSSAEGCTSAPTVAPTTVAPTTVAPTTVAPTTVAPTTVAPTTVAPTTVAPTTVAPTTVAPTTVAPTTVAPTTVAPTTVAPTTVAPTTVAPTTVAPTTPAPTPKPTPKPTPAPPKPTPTPSPKPTPKPANYTIWYILGGVVVVVVIICLVCCCKSGKKSDEGKLPLV